MLDAALEVEQSAKLGIVDRIASRHAFHARRLAMAGGARLPSRARSLAPELLALLDPQHAGIDGEVVLLRLRLGRDELAARTKIGRRNGALGLLTRNQHW